MKKNSKRNNFADYIFLLSFVLFVILLFVNAGLGIYSTVHAFQNAEFTAIQNILWYFSSGFRKWCFIGLIVSYITTHLCYNCIK